MWLRDSAIMEQAQILPFCIITLILLYQLTIHYPNKFVFIFIALALY
jgi:hypothetical protein